MERAANHVIDFIWFNFLVLPPATFYCARSLQKQSQFSHWYGQSYNACCKCSTRAHGLAFLVDGRFSVRSPERRQPTKRHTQKANAEENKNRLRKTLNHFGLLKYATSLTKVSRPFFTLVPQFRYIRRFEWDLRLHIGIHNTIHTHTKALPFHWCTPLELCVSQWIAI